MEKVQSREPWNKGKLIGQKPPLKLRDIWAIRIHLQLGKRIRDLAMFNLAIDSKLRGCDLVNLRVRDPYGVTAEGWRFVAGCGNALLLARWSIQFLPAINSPKPRKAPGGRMASRKP